MEEQKIFFTTFFRYVMSQIDQILPAEILSVFLVQPVQIDRYKPHRIRDTGRKRSRPIGLLVPRTFMIGTSQFLSAPRRTDYPDRLAVLRFGFLKYLQNTNTISRC